MWKFKFVAKLFLTKLVSFISKYSAVDNVWNNIVRYDILLIILTYILPSPPPTWGRDSKHIYLLLRCCQLFHSWITIHTSLYDYIIDLLPCNNYIHVVWSFDFGIFLWAVYFGLDGWVCIRVLCYSPLILGRHVFGAWGSYLPRPGHVPPARRPYFLEYYVNTCAHIRFT